MKKYLLVLLLAGCCLSVCAQIQRTFWGTVLGASNAEEVMQKIREQGHIYTFDARSRRISVINYTHPVTFANVACTATWFGFYEDRCYQVKFSFAKTRESDEAATFAEVEKAIARKYRKYLKKRITKRTNRTVTHLPQSPRKAVPEPTVTVTHYSDGKTLLTVDEQTMTVTYTDRQAQEDKTEKAQAELQDTRTFLGCELGVTTYAEAVRKLWKSDGSRLEQKGVDYLEKPIVFAGHEYYARFSFYHNVLYKVTFRSRADADAPSFDGLKRTLDRKHRRVRVRTTNEAVEYNNGQTRITLQSRRHFGKDTPLITLEYTDVKLWKEKESVHEEEI